jgi:hypothetical protein
MLQVEATNPNAGTFVEHLGNCRVFLTFSSPAITGVSEFDSSRREFLLRQELNVRRLIESAIGGGVVCMWELVTIERTGRLGES